MAAGCCAPRSIRRVKDHHSVAPQQDATFPEAARCKFPGCTKHIYTGRFCQQHHIKHGTPPYGEGEPIPDGSVEPSQEATEDAALAAIDDAFDAAEALMERDCLPKNTAEIIRRHDEMVVRCMEMEQHPSITARGAAAYILRGRAK